MKKVFSYVMLPLFIGVMYTLNAHAAVGDPKTSVGTVEVLPWYQSIEPYILAIFEVLVASAVSLGAALLYKLTGIKVEQSDRDAINMAAANAAGRILASVEGPVKDLKINLGSGPFASMIADEAEHIRKTLPDQLDRRGFDSARVAKMVQGKIGQLQNGVIATSSGSQT